MTHLGNTKRAFAVIAFVSVAFGVAVTVLLPSVLRARTASAITAPQ